MDWLFSPIDPGRAHEVGFAISWHARSMVLAWGILAPLAVLMARYFKVLPWQDWPRQLDNQVWWRSHWMGNAAVVMLSLFGLGLILPIAESKGLHGTLGYCVLAVMTVQVALGLLRGSKGGPTALSADGSPRGDHFDMTPRRVLFEYLHKGVGYVTLGLAIVTIVLGLWSANAPVWMWLCLTLWWCGLAAAAAWLQRRGRAVDTYQAIWGPDPELPGNRRKPIGWGIRQTKEKAHVRSH